MGSNTTTVIYIFLICYYFHYLINKLCNPGHNILLAPVCFISWKFENLLPSMISAWGMGPGIAPPHRSGTDYFTCVGIWVFRFLIINKSIVMYIVFDGRWTGQTENRYISCLWFLPLDPGFITYHKHTYFLF